MDNQVPSTTNQTSLSENAAGGLAYILIIPALVFLLTEPYKRNAYIRFHAWQCIYLAGAWAAFSIIVLLSTYLGPVFLAISYGLQSILTLLVLILWVMVLIKAFNGERYKLPIIGDMAERQAGQ